MHNFFTSIEFYVIACVVAAAIVIISAMPKQIGEARQFLLGGFLCFDSDQADTADNNLPKAQQNTSFPSNVSLTINQPISNHPSSLPSTSNQSTSNQSTLNPSSPVQSSSSAQTASSSVVEVTENGYKDIPDGKGKKQGKNKSQSQSNQNIPGWINGTAEGKEPEIDLLCLEDGTVKLIRKGLNGLVTADGAVSLACTLIGFDLKIEERLTYGGRNLKDPAPTEAVFSLEFLAPNEHYHIHYNSDTIHRMAAFTLATKGGIHVVKALA